ncbi:IS110 family transposase [Nocardioides sp. NPDC059952]|uniref:IS110 family transposase n=1 Tax=Nocardioides sp. NPDC059952 TaxID=3347014 RepID=UPI0036605143
MTIVADLFRFVVGVDTHAATHTYTILESSGRMVDQQQFPTSPAGLSRAIDWIGRRTDGDLDATLVAAEGTGTYGAILAGRLAASGFRVVEAPTPYRDRATGKNDAMDSLAAARSTLSMRTDRLRDRRGGGDQQTASVRTALQVLLAAREQATTERTRAVNALTALVRTHELGLDARRALTTTQITTISGWRRRQEPIDLATARAQATHLAARILDLDSHLSDNAHQIKLLVQDQAPVLLEQPGVGPVTAAIILTTWSHPGRVHSEAAFAKIAGTAPLPASSGNTQRHRLNRGGDRRLNRALHTIALTRMRCDPATRAYTERRRSEGKTTREVRRILKRYITRQLYRTLNTNIA